MTLDSRRFRRNLSKSCTFHTLLFWMCVCVCQVCVSWNVSFLIWNNSIFVPGDSKWPFHPLVGGHLTIPKRSLWITRLVVFHIALFCSPLLTTFSLGVCMLEVTTWRCQSRGAWIFIIWTQLPGGRGFRLIDCLEFLFQASTCSNYPPGN